MNESRRKFYHNFIRIIATVSATYFWQQRSYSTRGITGRCIHLWMISVTWQINWELSLFRKLRPLVPISITWRKGYQHSPMTTPKYHLPPLANLASLQKRRFTKLHSWPYANIPSDRLHLSASTDHNENGQFIPSVWAIYWWLEVCACPSTAEKAWAIPSIQKLQTCQQPAVRFKADWKDGVWANTHPYDDSFTISWVSVCIS